MGEIREPGFATPAPRGQLPRPTGAPRDAGVPTPMPAEVTRRVDRRRRPPCWTQRKESTDTYSVELLDDSNLPPLAQVQALIDSAHNYIERGNLGAAVIAADQALVEAAKTPQDDVADLVKTSRPLFDRIFAAYVGLLGQVPVRARSDEEIAGQELGERTEYLLASIDGTQTLEQLASQHRNPAGRGDEDRRLAAGGRDRPRRRLNRPATERPWAPHRHRRRGDPDGRAVLAAPRRASDRLNPTHLFTRNLVHEGLLPPGRRVQARARRPRAGRHDGGLRNDHRDRGRRLGRWRGRWRRPARRRAQRRRWGRARWHRRGARWHRRGARRQRRIGRWSRRHGGHRRWFGRYGRRRAGRHGAGGSTSGTGGSGGTGGASCSDIQKSFVAALAEAKGCVVGGTGYCGRTTLDRLDCGCPTYVSKTGVVDAVRTQWAQSGCSSGACPTSFCVVNTGATCGVPVGGASADLSGFVEPVDPAGPRRPAPRAAAPPAPWSPRGRRRCR